jgi:hypothetical protein
VALENPDKHSRWKSWSSESTRRKEPEYATLGLTFGGSDVLYI